MDSPSLKTHFLILIALLELASMWYDAILTDEIIHKVEIIECQESRR